MKRLFATVFGLLIAASLSGCMALVLAPAVNGLMDKDATVQYSSSASRPALYNATLRALNAKGADGINSDRETGIIRCSVSVTMGQAAYEVNVQIDDDGPRSKLRMTSKSASMYKLDFKRSSEFSAEVITEIERQLGSKLQRI